MGKYFGTGKTELILYAVLFLLALFLRMYRIGELPYGLHVDEAGMAYDAFSLANWGLDRYYKFYPVYFINYGGGQSVLYGYLCAALLKFLEPTAAVIRIPAVAFGMLTWLFGTLLIRENIGKRAGVIGSLLLAVCPCFIFTSRLALDCLLFSGAGAASLYCLTRAVKAGRGKKALLLYMLTGAGFGVSLYTYALSWIAVPLFLLFALGYLLYIGRLSWKRVFAMGIPLGILAAPLIAFWAINTFELPEIATVRFTIPRLPGYRGSEVSLTNVINNVPRLIETYFFNDDWAYNSTQTWFSMYLISIPFACIGIGEGARRTFRALKEKRISGEAFVFFWFLAQTCMGLVIEEPNVNKMNAVYFALLYFTVRGIRWSWRRLSSVKARKIFACGTASVYVIFSVTFIGYYFLRYTDATYPLSPFSATYADVLDEWEDVIGDRAVHVDVSYVYYALGERLSPMEFQLIEQGMTGRGNIHFGLPEELDEDGFYIIFRKGSYADRLQADGYHSEKSGMFTVFYKDVTTQE